MAGITVEIAMRQLLSVIQEGFEGPQQKWSYFTDNDPKAGLFGTLSELRLEEVSKIVGGDTIASHVHHIIFGLEVSSGWIKGDRSTRDWSESWSVNTVDVAEWSELLSRIRAGYDELRSAIQTSGADDEQALGSAVGALAHAAYHLGAIQAMVTVLRNPA